MKKDQRRGIKRVQINGSQPPSHRKTSGPGHATSRVGKFVRGDNCQTCICLGLPTSLMRFRMIRMWSSWTLLMTLSYFAQGRFCQGRKGRQNLVFMINVGYRSTTGETFLGSDDVKGCHWTIGRCRQCLSNYSPSIGGFQQPEVFLSEHQQRVKGWGCSWIKTLIEY